MNTYQKIKEGIPNTLHIPSELEMLCEWVDQNGYPISGYFELNADDGETMQYWLGFDHISDRFGIFGAGPDGSLYALWIDDEGVQKIVHLGSEGEQKLILAENFIDFLRLLAIGYDEIGFADLDMTLQEWNSNEDDPNEGSNPNFMEWVKTKFDVDIPERGNEIVNANDDSFRNWIDLQIEKYSE